MKKLAAIIVASAALLIAVPVASAAGPSANNPPQMSTVSCSLNFQGVSRSWSFQLPSFALPWFESALAQVEQRFSGLSCSIS